MKIKITRKLLGDTLARVGKIVERRNMIPILSNVLLTARAGSPGTLAVRGTDLDIEMTSTIEAHVEVAGSTTVAAHLLEAIIRKLPEKNEISLEQEDPGADLVVRSGRGKFALRTLPVEDMPSLATGTLSHHFNVPASVARNLVAACAYAISNEGVRYFLNGIFLHATDLDGKAILRAVSTDGHRLARFTTDAPEGSRDMPGIIIPRKTTEILARLAEGAGDADIGVSLSPTKIVFEAGGDVLASKLIDGTFPDYARIIPAGHRHSAILDTALLSAAIDRVACVSSERARAVKFALRGGSLEVSVRNPDAGESIDAIDADYDGPDFEIGFNATYAISTLAALGGDTVILEVNDPGSAGVLRTRGGALLCLLMPLRV
jgi:DNA polymerase-3 subunit beta